jgi:DNA repair exonuclease SbcCD ATPase subunit
VKFNNILSIEKKITKAFDVLNNLGQRMNIVISSEYLRLKLSELYLCHEYQNKKQEEKEEQRRIREQMREEAKLQKEIEEMKDKIEKEERHFNKALQSVNEQIQKATTETEKELLASELNNIQEKLSEVEKNKQDVQYREQNTRAGYVYIISNMGSFGENVYKIGVTRRLDPQERVDELGDASVPFYFDVHAMIFSDDAPSLENALHKAFDNRRLNRINLRREFFKVTLDEIEDMVKKNFNKPVEFTKVAEAEQYRQSLILRSNIALLDN